MHPPAPPNQSVPSQYGPGPARMNVLGEANEMTQTAARNLPPHELLPLASGTNCYEYPHGSPSLLGQPYIAAQGPKQLVVGATKSYGWTAEAALAACRRSDYAAVPYGFRRVEAVAATATAINAGRVSAATADADAGASALMAVEKRVGSDTTSELRGAAEEPPQTASWVGTVGGPPLEAAAEVEALRRAACAVWEPLADWRMVTVRWGPGLAGWDVGCEQWSRWE